MSYIFNVSVSYENADERDLSNMGDPSLKYLNWTSEDLQVQFEISDPLQVSQGSNIDTITLGFLHTDYFVSANGSTLEYNEGGGDFQYEINYELPKMLPAGVDAEALAATA